MTERSEFVSVSPTRRPTAVRELLPLGQNARSANRQEIHAARNLPAASADPMALAPDQEFAELIDDSWRRTVTAHRESYAADLVVFLTWIAVRGTHRRDVSRPDVDRYRHWLGELVDEDDEPAVSGRARCAPATIARKLAAVRSFSTWVGPCVAVVRIR